MLVCFELRLLESSVVVVGFFPASGVKALGQSNKSNVKLITKNNVQHLHLSLGAEWDLLTDKIT